MVKFTIQPRKYVGDFLIYLEGEQYYGALYEKKNKTKTKTVSHRKGFEAG